MFDMKIGFGIKENVVRECIFIIHFLTTLQKRYTYLCKKQKSESSIENAMLLLNKYNFS